MLWKLDAGIQTYATCSPEVHHLYEQWIKEKVEEGQENLRELEADWSEADTDAATDSLVTLPTAEQEAARPVDDTPGEVETTAPEAPEPGGQSIESTEDLQPGASPLAINGSWVIQRQGYGHLPPSEGDSAKVVGHERWRVRGDLPGCRRKASHDTVVQAIKRTQAEPK